MSYFPFFLFFFFSARSSPIEMSLVIVEQSSKCKRGTKLANSDRSSAPSRIWERARLKTRDDNSGNEEKLCVAGRSASVRRGSFCRAIPRREKFLLLLLRLLTAMRTRITINIPLIDSSPIHHCLRSVTYNPNFFARGGHCDR